MDKLTRNLLTVGVLALVLGANAVGRDAPAVVGTLMLVWMFYLASTAPKASKTEEL